MELAPPGLAPLELFVYSEPTFRRLSFTLPSLPGPFFELAELTLSRFWGEALLLLVFAPLELLDIFQGFRR